MCSRYAEVLARAGFPLRWKLVESLGNEIEY